MRDCKLLTNVEENPQVVYRDIQHNGKSYRLKVIFTKHYIERSSSRVVSFSKMFDLLEHGFQYLIEIANYNYYINSRNWKRYVKLISTRNNFAIVLQCLWSNDRYNDELGECDYDMKLTMVTTVLNLFRCYSYSRRCRAVNNKNTFSFNV